MFGSYPAGALAAERGSSSLSAAGSAASERTARAESDRVRVLVVDDHAIAREGLKAILETDPEIEVVGEAADGREALEKTAALQPDVVFLDVRLPEINGIEVARRIKSEHPHVAVVLLSGYSDDALVVEALQAGAAGFLLKTASEELLLHTVHVVASGGCVIEMSLLHAAASQTPPMLERPARPDLPAVLPEELSEREREVLRLLAEGYTNKEIAERLSVAEVTVKKHVQSIMAKLGATDRTHAAILGLRLGLIA
jgi:DNA-binding NarL/FixJ family response regulator